jgi:hypothetical protein
MGSLHANEYSCTYTGAQINFGDLTPYLTYAWKACSRNRINGWGAGNEVVHMKFIYAAILRIRRML